MSVVGARFLLIGTVVAWLAVPATATADSSGSGTPVCAISDPNPDAQDPVTGTQSSQLDITAGDFSLSGNDLLIELGMAHLSKTIPSDGTVLDYEVWWNNPPGHASAPNAVDVQVNSQGNVTYQLGSIAQNSGASFTIAPEFSAGSPTLATGQADSFDTFPGPGSNRIVVDVPLSELGSPHIGDTLTGITAVTDAGTTVYDQDGGASTNYTIGQTTCVDPEPPHNTVPPTITGTAQDGQTLAATGDSWLNSSSISYAWEDCDSSGNNCTAIPNATGSSYTLTPSDVGSTIEVQETAANSNGSSAVTSGPSAVVLPLPPSNLSLPSISGTAQQGQTLAVAQGSWSNNPTSISDQWERCDGSGNNCQLTGVTGSTYTPQQSDVGYTFAVLESASNAGGTGTQVASAPTAAVLPLPPVNSGAPTIAGTAQQGQTLTVSQGSWSNNPTSISDQWERCDSSGNNCQLTGVTGSSYTLQPSDVGYTLEVLESASNAGGSGTPVASAPTAVVLPLPPVNSGVPTITGKAQQGQTLTETNGTWSNNPTSYTYQWERCDSSGNCTSIAGATSQSYVLQNSDVGYTVEVLESASNAGGTGTPVASAPTVKVIPLPPAATKAPTVSGTAQQGQTLTLNRGTWSNAPSSYAYQWEDCDYMAKNCTAISGATGTTYKLQSSDLNYTIRVRVSATNDGGTTTVMTAPTQVVTAPASNTGGSTSGSGSSGSGTSSAGSSTTSGSSGSHASTGTSSTTTPSSTTTHTTRTTAATKQTKRHVRKPAKRRSRTHKKSSRRR
jgi:hypothetical protein